MVPGGHRSIHPDVSLDHGGPGEPRFGRIASRIAHSTTQTGVPREVGRTCAQTLDERLRIRVGNYPPGSVGLDDPVQDRSSEDRESRGQALDHRAR